MNRRVSILALATLASTVASADIFTPSTSEQVKLGRDAAAQIRKKEKVLSANDDRVRLVRRIGQRLISTIKTKEPWDFSFDVIVSKELNAFSLPGGPSFIYTGLLDKCTTEDQIAAVMGHELTHCRHQHWAKDYGESQKRALGWTILLGATHANSSLANIAGIADQVFVGMTHSRKQESDADDTGFDMMIDAGYNPNGMADVFRILKAGGGGGGPEWLSDHPSDERRIRHVEDRIKSMNHNFPAQTPLRKGD